MTKRIKPERVAKAFVKNKLLPKDGEFYDEIGGMPCACGLGVLLYDPRLTDGGLYRFRGVDDAANELHLDVEYSQGFMNGFDGIEPEFFDTAEGDEGIEGIYLMGYTDGTEAHRQSLVAVGRLRE